MGKIFDYDGVPVLHTTSGDLKGYFYDGVYIYKGIPYAYENRFFGFRIEFVCPDI